MPGFENRGFGDILCSAVAWCRFNNDESVGDPGKRRQHFYKTEVTILPLVHFQLTYCLNQHCDSHCLMSIFKMFHQTCYFSVVVILHKTYVHADIYLLEFLWGPNMAFTFATRFTI